MQHQRHAVLFRQGEQRLAQCQGLLIRRGHGDGRQLRQGQMALPPAQERLALVDEDAVEPGAEVFRAAQRIALVPGAQQRFLHGVLRVGAAGCVADGDAVHLPLLRERQAGECFLIHGGSSCGCVGGQGFQR